MKETNQNTDDNISLDWQNLEKIISEEVSPLPNDVLDKQIIAAAHRELSVPNKRDEYQLSWWRRISLPLYVTAGFTFSIFALQPLWLEPDQTMQAENPRAITLDIAQEANLSQQESESNAPTKRELPELLEVPDPIETTSKEPVEVTLAQQKPQQLVEEIDASEVYTGTPMSKVIYPEKEAWVRKIIILMKNADNDEARTELVRFKKAYPNYPIEEQIKGLNR